MIRLDLELQAIIKIFVWLVKVTGLQVKRQNDGILIFTIYVSDKDYNDYIQIEIWWRPEFISLTYLTLEYEQSYPILDSKEYKSKLLDDTLFF